MSLWRTAEQPPYPNPKTQTAYITQAEPLKHCKPQPFPKHGLEKQGMQEAALQSHHCNRNLHSTPGMSHGLQPVRIISQLPSRTRLWSGGSRQSPVVSVTNSLCCSGHISQHLWDSICSGLTTQPFTEVKVQK